MKSCHFCGSGDFSIDNECSQCFSNFGMLVETSSHPFVHLSFENWWVRLNFADMTDCAHGPSKAGTTQIFKRKNENDTNHLTFQEIASLPDHSITPANMKERIKKWEAFL